MGAGYVFTKESRPTLRDRAVQQIKRAILSGKLKSGSRLIEQELSEKMGMSRFPVREAFASLECEGLVTIEPYKGAFISIPDSTEIVETYEIRELLEAHALSLAMRGDVAGIAARLSAIISAMDAATEPSREDFLRNDFEFHETLCKLTGNSVLSRTWLTLSTKIQILLNEELHVESMSQMCRNHQRLCTLIASGDVAAASGELRAHLQRGKASLLSLRRNKGDREG